MDDPKENGATVNRPASDEASSNEQKYSTDDVDLFNPEDAAELLAPCPPSGTGVHRWLYGAACTLVDVGLSDTDAEATIKFEMSREPSPENEITDALAAARGERADRTPRWPAVSPVAVASALRDRITLEELTARSPESVQTIGTAGYLDVLFPDAPLICMGTSVKNCLTAPREDWRGTEHFCELIVPSPMKARCGLNKKGRMSSRCLDNTGSRRYLVVEFDEGEIDTHAALLWHLAQYAPLVCCVHSAGKSLHGWFHVEGEPEERIEEFFAYAVSLGADPATWTRCQLVRLPDGRRNGESPRRQAVFYWNPGAI